MEARQIRLKCVGVPSCMKCSSSVFQESFVIPPLGLSGSMWGPNKLSAQIPAQILKENTVGDVLYESHADFHLPTKAD
jgi:hypothetical protein